MARSYSSRYSHIDRDDCVQELFLELLRPGVQRAVENALDADDYVAFRCWARAAVYEREMRRQGLIFAEDQYHYSPEVVKAALRVGLAYRRADIEPAWPAGDEEDSGVRAKTDPAEGNNLQAMMLDVLRGFDALPVSDQMVLELADFLGLTLAQVGARLQVTEVAAKHLHSRAINKLIDVLGGARRMAAADHDGPGSRSAMSNEEAQRQV